MTAPRPRLLIVDDEPYNRELLERTFARHADLVVVSAADEALAACELGAFDVLVTDQRLAGGTGTELAARLRARWPATRVIVITGLDDDDGDLARARAAGIVDDIIGKPWLPTTLRSRVLGGR